MTSAGNHRDAEIDAHLAAIHAGELDLVQLLIDQVAPASSSPVVDRAKAAAASLLAD